MSKINLNEVSSAGRPTLKSGEYIIRVIKCEKGKSKKGNEMLTFQYEIASPESVTEGEGKVRKIAGLQLTDWIVLADTGLPRLKGLHKALKLPMEVDLETPNTKQYIGKAVRVQLRTETQAAKNEVSGEPLLDDDGNPIIDNNYRIARFLGANEEHTIPMDKLPY